MNICVDAMGGDNAPREIVLGCVDALNKYKDISITLTGDRNAIKNILKDVDYKKKNLKIVNTTEIVENSEPPINAIRKKKDSSLVVGLNMLKNKEVDAFISAGSSGALLSGATLLVGRIPGIKRPALAPLMPNKKGFSLIIDAGANVDAKPEYLLQFAQMGSLYMEYVLDISNPKVGLINIGEEKEKGNKLTKEAYTLLENSQVNFIGNIEARDTFEGNCDVMACDAFVGNVILKNSEGLGLAFFDIIKEEITKSTVSKLAALILKPAFKNIKKRFDYSEYGGAPFLGINGLVIKAHGSSDKKAIESAIKQAIKFNQKDLINKINESINK